MPFDLVMDDLYPTIANMAPPDRLEALRRWLNDMDPADPRWRYESWFGTTVEPNCGTFGCAGGWYMFHVRPDEFGAFMDMTNMHVVTVDGSQYSPAIIRLAEEFEISAFQSAAIFARADWFAPGTGGDDRMSPQDIAFVIDLVQRQMIPEVEE